MRDCLRAVTHARIGHVRSIPLLSMILLYRTYATQADEGARSTGGSTHEETQKRVADWRWAFRVPGWVLLPLYGRVGLWAIVTPTFETWVPGRRPFFSAWTSLWVFNKMHDSFKQEDHEKTTDRSNMHVVQSIRF